MAVAFSDILTALAGYLELPDQLGVTAASIATAGATTFTMATSSDPIPLGSKVEIEHELLRVTGFARGSPNDTYTVVRGIEGSTAVAHTTVGTPVFVDPKYPRWLRKRAVNRVLTEWVSAKAPRVLQDTSQTFSPISGIVAVPATAIDVLEVGWVPPGYTELWSLKHGAPRPYPTSLISTGRGVALYGEMGLPGYIAYVSYTVPWSELALDADTLPAEFPGGKDMLAAGAAAAMLGAKFNLRATFDAAQVQRAEQKAGQAMDLTRQA